VYCEWSHIKKEEKIKPHLINFKFGFVINEIIYECEKKLIEMETECHVIVVEENLQVRSFSLYLKY